MGGAQSELDRISIDNEIEAIKKQMSTVKEEINFHSKRVSDLCTELGNLRRKLQKITGDRL